MFDGLKRYICHDGVLYSRCFLFKSIHGLVSEDNPYAKTSKLDSCRTCWNGPFGNGEMVGLVVVILTIFVFVLTDVIKLYLVLCIKSLHGEKY